MVDKWEFKQEYKRYLPHIHSGNMPCFITWRLKFQIPKVNMDKYNNLKELHSQELSTFAPEQQESQTQKHQKQLFAAFDDIMHNLEAYPQILKDDDNVSELKKVIHAHDKVMYKLYCYCIMPNHVHVLLEPLTIENSFTPLSKIMQTIKGSSSYNINKLRNASGSIWQKESYDHVVRSDDEFKRIIGYILNNPVKSGLVDNWHDWKHNWIADELCSDY